MPIRKVEKWTQTATARFAFALIVTGGLLEVTQVAADHLGQLGPVLLTIVGAITAALRSIKYEKCTKPDRR